MKVDRQVRTIYTVRVVAFIGCFLAVALHAWERGFGAAVWISAALQFLLYPHLAYLRSAHARDQRGAEYQNLYADSFLLGIWIAVLEFPVWIAFPLTFSPALNGIVNRGLQGFAVSLVLTCLGILAGILGGGFRYSPLTSGLTTALCFFGSLAYCAGVGYVLYRQTRRMAETREKLRESERRYRLITEHAGDLVAMVDCDARWLYASPSYGRFLSAEDLAPGGDAFRKLHEEDQIRVRAALQVLVRSGVSCKLHMRLHTRHGEVCRIESLVHAVRDEEGAITGAVMASTDVTELRDREEQLEVAGLAFERMAEAMMITSASGRILTINQAFTRITGYPPPEVLGQHESKFRSGMQSDTFYDDMYATVLRTGHWRGTTWCQRRDGTVYREWRSVSAVRDADDRVTHYVTLFGELDGLAADRGVETQPPEQPARSA